MIGDKHWFRYAPGAIGPDECALLLSVAAAAGFVPVREGPSPGGRPLEGPAGYQLRGPRQHTRAAIEHPGLAAALWDRIAHLTEDQGDAPLGLNERLRFYAYEAGDAFAPHTDGAFCRAGQESRLTLLIYLTGGYEGGELILLEGGPTFTPSTGDVLLFPHARWHEGRPVRAGRKVVLRTDVLFAAPDGITGGAA